MTHSGVTDPDPLEVIGERYQLLRELRQEPWGAVWLAQDRLLGAEFGLKLLEREAPEFEEAKPILQQEALLALRLRHPQIMGVFHYGEAQEALYLLQSPFAGESLLSHLTRLERFNLNQALHLLEQVGGALAYAHEQGVTHQSLNPLHILVMGQEVRLANFTFPPLEDEEVTHLELKAYNPPEVIRGEPLTPAGNVFSLGVLGFRLLAGSLPYPLTFDEPFPYRLESPPVDLEEVPTPLQNILLHCLAQDPEERLQDAGAFLAQLKELRELWRSGRREKWVSWPSRPEGQPEGRPVWESAAAAGAKLWETGRAHAGKLREQLQPHWQRIRPEPRRLWWGLGLAGLAVILMVAGAKLLSRTSAPPAAKLAPAPVSLKLPAAGGPPLAEMAEPSAPARESVPARRPGAAQAPAAKATAPTKPRAQEERYLVLAASYVKPEPALRLQKRLRARKIRATVVKVSVGGKPGYQVRVGPLTGSKAAEEVAQRLRTEEKLSPKVIKARSRPPKTTASRSPGR